MNFNKKKNMLIIPQVFYLRDFSILLFENKNKYDIIFKNLNW